MGKIKDLEQQLSQREQDFHFDMRNKQMEIVILEDRLLKVTMKNADLVDELKNIVLTLKYDITQFKEICEEKSINASNDYNDDLKNQNRESKEVFKYLRNLFDVMIRELFLKISIKKIHSLFQTRMIILC